MEPEDLLFWVDTYHPADGREPGVLCRRHADAMVVPRGWTLDDRREPHPRLFRPPIDASGSIARPKRRSRTDAASVARQHIEQLELSAIEPNLATSARPADASLDVADDAPTPWVPDFDVDDDLDGLLQVRSPLLARAFRGTDRVR